MATEIDSLQMTLFARSPPRNQADDLWRLSFNEKPASFQTVMPGHTLASGPSGGLGATLLAQPARVDLVFSGSSVPPSAAAQSTIPDLEAAWELGFSALLKVAAQIRVVRMAVVIQQSQMMRSEAEAVEIVKKNFSSMPVPTGATNLYYQTNVPTPSKTTPGEMLNRLCRWNTGVKQFIGLSNADLGSIGQSSYIIAAKYFDVSNSSNRDRSEDDIKGSMTEMFELCKTLIRDGYDAL